MYQPPVIDRYAPYIVPVVFTPVTPTVFFAYDTRTPILSLLPQEIQLLAGNIPGLLLDGEIARQFAQFYTKAYYQLDDNKAPDTSHEKFFKFVISNNGVPLTGIDNQHVIHRIRECGIDILAVNQINNGCIIKAKKDDLSFSFVIPQVTLAGYLDAFEGYQKYLVDIGNNQIIFKNKETADTLFNLCMPAYQASESDDDEGIDDESPEAIDEHTEFNDEDDQEHEDDSASSVSEDSFHAIHDATDDASSSTHSDASSISSESPEDATPTEDAEKQVEATVLAPVKRKQNEKPESKKQKRIKKKADATKPIQEHTPAPEVKIAGPSFSLHPLLTLFRGPQERKRHAIPPVQQTKRAYGPSERQVFLDKLTPYPTLSTTEIKATMFEASFFDYLSNTGQTTIKGQEDLKQKLREFAILNLFGCVESVEKSDKMIKKQIEDHISLDELNKSRFLTLMSWIGLSFIGYEAYTNDLTETHPVPVYSTLSLMAISVVMATGGFVYNIQKKKLFDLTILKESLDIQMDELRNAATLSHAPQDPKLLSKRAAKANQTPQLGRVILALMLFQELELRRCKTKDYYHNEPNLNQCIINLSTLIQIEPARYFVENLESVSRERVTSVVTESILSLLTIHGKNLWSLMLENKVPEITLGMLTNDQKHDEIQQVIASIKEAVSQLEFARRDNKKAKVSADSSGNINTLLNKAFLLYALRDRHTPSMKFIQFEAEYPEMTQFINHKIDAYTKANKLYNVHQCPFRSCLFDCALNENRPMALKTLEHMTRPASPILSWEPVALAPAMQALKSSDFRRRK